MTEEFKLINQSEEHNGVLANFDPAIFKLSYLSESIRSFFRSVQEGLKAL